MRESQPHDPNHSREGAPAADFDGPALLEEAQALVQVGSWAFHYATGEMLTSRGLRHLFELPPGPVTSEEFFQRIYEDDRSRVREQLTRVYAATIPECELEYRLRQRDGQIRWIHARCAITYDERGRPRTAMGIVQDVTERKLGLEELRASELRYRRIAAIVEWSNDAIVACDLDGTISSWNRSAARLFGYFEDEVIGRPISIIIPDSRREEAARLVAGVIAGEPLEHHLTVHRKKDGSYVEVSLTLSPIRDGDGQIVGLSRIVRDLSEQRRTEVALRRAEQQLREAQKMEAVGLLAGGIAHDFNNMLSVIVGYTELVLENLGPHDPIRSDVLEIRKAGGSAVSLTRQLLAFSRRQMLQPRVIDLNQIVTTLERMMRRLIGAQYDVRFELSQELGRVSADPGQIEQVIINLVLNARDAMAEGGTLTLASANVELDPAHAESLGLSPGPYVMLAVSDSGCGIDATTRARIFEPFFTTKEKGKGTGLGLSTALGIVQQSHGGIELESQVGVGTTFRIYLPRTERPAQSAYSVPPARVTQRSWETVLLVEDDDQVRALARTALRRQGYQVLEAEHGEQALSICEQHLGSIHLLLTDVVMPKMGGRELAERASAIRPEMKVLFMSGYSDDVVAREGELSEQVGLIHKPITPASLSRKVREVLDGR